MVALPVLQTQLSQSMALTKSNKSQILLPPERQLRSLSYSKLSQARSVALRLR